MKLKNITEISGATLVALFLTVAEVFLAIRFVLHFFAVNPNNGFAAWVFHSTDGLMSPWRGVFTQTSISGHPHYVDTVLLFIMAAYAVVAALMAWVFTHYGDILGRRAANNGNGRKK